MRKFIVSKLVQLAKFVSKSEGVQKQLDTVTGRMDMDEIYASGNWG